MALQEMDVYRLCNEKKYFTHGDNSQYDRMFNMLSEEKQDRKDLEENSRIVKALSNSVQQLNEGLKAEVDLRKNIQIELDKKLAENTNEINNKLKFVKGALWLATAFASVVVTLLITWIGGWLNF